MSCKGCNRKTDFSSSQVDELIKEQLALEENLVDDIVYERRIDKCNQCTALLNQTTCSYCGCFVKFRARLAYKTCPYPSGGKWDI
ncbi:DUF6171 family protein [Oceanobacillus sp. 1P07AA]|uniref:DUF6171 family protein n=1 Tax=Oceanobacillus sp. 1P07AA TaxID=3132293 RepID=UPI0039A787B2